MSYYHKPTKDQKIKFLIDECESRCDVQTKHGTQCTTIVSKGYFCSCHAPKAGTSSLCVIEKDCLVAILKHTHVYSVVSLSSTCSYMHTQVNLFQGVFKCTCIVNNYNYTLFVSTVAYSLEMLKTFSNASNLHQCEYIEDLWTYFSAHLCVLSDSRVKPLINTITQKHLEFTNPNSSNYINNFDTKFYSFNEKMLSCTD